MDCNCSKKGQKLTRIILKESIITESEIIISEDNLHYLIKVHRHKTGDNIFVQDKTGSIFKSLITATSKKKVTVRILNQHSIANTPLDISIITALPKGNILDNIIRNLSELGVNKIIPAIYKRSVAEANQNRLERWKRIARESMRQCIRSRPLIIDNPIFLEDALKNSTSDIKIFLHPYAKETIGQFFTKRTNKTLTAVIGPEGGFTDRELELATKHAFIPLKSGNFILKIETAILTAAITGVAHMGGFD